MDIPPNGRVSHGLYVGMAEKLNGLKVGSRVAVPLIWRGAICTAARKRGMKVVTRKLDLFDNVWVYRVS